MAPSWIRWMTSSRPARVPPHETGPHLEALFLRQVNRFEHSPHARRIDGKRLLHEDVDAFADGVFEVQRAEGGRRGQDHHVAGREAVDGLLVGVESQEAAIGTRVELAGKLLLEQIVAAFEAVFEQIGHGVELDGAAAGREGVGDARRCRAHRSRRGPA